MHVESRVVAGRYRVETELKRLFDVGDRRRRAGSLVVHDRDPTVHRLDAVGSAMPGDSCQVELDGVLEGDRDDVRRPIGIEMGERPQSPLAPSVGKRLSTEDRLIELGVEDGGCLVERSVRIPTVASGSLIHLEDEMNE